MGKAKKQTLAKEIKEDGDWNPRKIAKLAKLKGNHAMGSGLYLRVREGRQTYWQMRYTSPTTKKRTWMELGYYPSVIWENAVHDTQKNLQMVKEGIDPKEQRAKEKKAKELENARNTYTVRQSIRDYFDAHKHEWKNEKNIKQWVTLVERNLDRDILQTPLAQLESKVIKTRLSVLAQEMYPTYKKVRQRLIRSFEEAVDNGYIETNPLQNVRRHKRPADKPEQPYPSLDWRKLTEFLPELRDCHATMPTRLALEWLVLSGSRPGEVRHARWDQIIHDRKMWIISEAEMKIYNRSDVNGDHKIHLTARHLEILKAMEYRRGPWPWIFPGQTPTKPMSENTMNKVLTNLGYKGEATTHGFRATMKTWAIDRWRYDDRIIEASIAHKESKMERSYNRSDYWSHRIALAEEYANWCLHGIQPPTERLKAAD